MQQPTQGAEAVLTVEGGDVVKDRQPKRYRLPALDTQLRRRRTRAEASIMADAARAGVLVPRIRDVQESVIRMERIAGPRLKEALDALPEAARYEAVRQVGETVAQLHAAGIMHGDLTTSNMIYKDGRLYLIDFGLAKRTAKVEDLASDLFLLHEALTASHVALGEAAWEGVLKAYKRKYPNASAVLAQLEKIRKRRRYRE
ncbi:MAG: Kae1-associated serine/threonine protein kinase [Candidatus Aenigmarchaeota archaeon]|nr:Kae1-associated serine/threonine protein kinase [Candidatus Aenigmarchaeota archaeon]